MSTVLEYVVDASGHVSTEGIYREITLAQWDNLPRARRQVYSRYAPMLEAVAQGKIAAVRAADRKRSWNIVRSIYQAAKRRGLAIETRRVIDPEVQGGELVLVRARQ